MSAILMHTGIVSQLSLLLVSWLVVLLACCTVRLWRALSAEKEAIKHADKRLREFIAVASHEIRTPLHVVNGYCELLALTNLSEEQTSLITNIQRACDVIIVVTDNVLDHKKLDSDAQVYPTDTASVDLREMIENLARMTDIELGQCPVDVVVAVTNDVPPLVSFNHSYTLRILINLLSNARKFCDAGYIGVFVSMNSAGQVKIEISDSGCGIPNSFRDALFEPYRQANLSLTRPRQGIGLGLSIVQRLLERVNGTVKVDTIEGEGSTFTVILPTVSLGSSNRSERPRPSKKLKVIYDHVKTASYYVDTFSLLGLTATCAPPDLSTSELTTETDFIWTNTSTLRISPSLVTLVSEKNHRSSPLVFLVYSNAAELQQLDLSMPGVVLVKRPVIVHSLPALLEDIVPPPMVPVTSPLRPGLSLQVTSKGRVLIAEDNPINLNPVHTLLRKLGYEVIAVTNGREAVEKAKDGPYICCLMDCQMPILDGFAATCQIRELENDGTIRGRLPIIALTADVSHENKDKCRSAGMDFFLGKPVKLQDIKDTVEKLLPQ